MEPWTSFWQQGHSTTFGPFFKNGYEGAVKNWWLDVLKIDKTRVDLLDIGCGNGALLIDTLGFLENGSYTGIDLADVQFSEPALKKMSLYPEFEATLHNQTAAESLPFSAASFDLVSSIFGIEYSDLNKSIPEAFRVLRPNGAFKALIHAKESVITEMSVRALGEYRDADMSTILESLTTIDAELNRLKSPASLKKSNKAESARSNLNTLAQKYMSNLDPRTGNAIMVQFVGDSLKFFKILRHSEAVRRDYLNGLKSEFDASRSRYKAMAAAAKSADQIGDITAVMQDIGFKSVESAYLHSDQEKKEIAAWQLTATK